VPQGMLLGFANICETLLNLKAQYGIFSWELVAHYPECCTQHFSYDRSME